MNTAARTSKQLGSDLRRYRKKRGLTQAQLSGQINKRQATISNLESAGNGTIRTLLSVLSALDLEFSIRPRSKGARTKLADIF